MYFRNQKIKRVLLHAFIIVFGLCMIYPVLWMIAGSLKNNNEILNSALNLIPTTFRWENFQNGWKGFGGISFGTFFINSIIVSSVSTLGTVLSSACVAYALTRINFKGKKIWFAVMLATMMIPTQVILIPQYLIWNQLGMVGTYVPLVLPHWFGQAFFIYQMMQFMVSIPTELDEAAYMDGCSKYSIFARVIFPLLKPAIVTTVIIQFYWKWDDFLGPLVYLDKPASYTVSLALKMFADTASRTDFGAMFAMSTLSLLPVFLIFLFFNKYLVEGISTSGLKG
ncbi:multiple sugar transport system permease protein [Pilibacter termitis]|uniref:Multiple sugar transport system permease protein n=1 Tax=Pilibacter termitis TaxID=263852 RepID=A0A1T4KQZ6_9ENTE|nr:carbohydrate ABC transporter permease [Pilibacter termitis]SJZ44869.1 multiple sugar transport system permease protein [Pilibacter termitis]